MKSKAPEQAEASQAANGTDLWENIGKKKNEITVLQRELFT